MSFGDDARYYFLCGAVEETLHQERRCAAGMREDPFLIRKFGGCTAEYEAGDGARRVCPVFDDSRCNIRDDVAATIGFFGMRIHHSFSPVQFLMDGSEHGVSEESIFDASSFVLIDRMQTDPVGLQHVHRVLDFFEASVDIR